MSGIGVQSLPQFHKALVPLKKPVGGCGHLPFDFERGGA